MNILNNLRIKNKLSLMLLVPFIGLFYFLLIDIQQKVTLQKDLDDLQDLVTFVLDVDELLHKTQLERGLSSGFMSNESNEFKEMLVKHRSVTDKAIANFKASIDAFTMNHDETQLNAAINQAKINLEDLQNKRRTVDQKKISLKETLNYYTHLNLSLLNITEFLKKMSTDDQISKALSAYINFIRSEERQGYERALLIRAFSTDSFTNEEFILFNRIDSERETYYAVFQSFASKDIQAFSNEIFSRKESQEVDRLIDIAFEKSDQGNFGIDPEYWHNMATQKLDLIQLVSEKLSSNIIADTQALKEAAKSNLLKTIIFAGVLILLSLYLVYNISIIIVGSILKLRDVTKEMIENGNSTIQVNISNNDEIGDLGASFNKMMLSLREKSQDLEKENWFKTQISRISEITQGINDLEKLGNLIVSELADQLNFGFAAFYVKESVVRNDQYQDFILSGSYACKNHPNIASKIRLGEGVVGQSIHEKKPIILSEVPNDYIKINSALGENKPGYIIALPVLFEGRVNGVIELAAFKAFSDIELELLNKVADNLGIIINSVMSSQRTQNLLEESQKKSEELQTQQEELKSSNEELEEQTSLLKESESKLQMQSEELRQANEELEEKAEFLEKQKVNIEKQNLRISTSKLEIEEKAKELEVASKYKSEFLANMSHELRTPLNSLLILAKSLSDNEEGNLTQDQIEDANVILGGGKDLLILINDILDLSKVEAGQLDILVEDIYVESILKDVRKQFDVVSKEKKLEFRTNKLEGVPKIIKSDELRVGQIIKNMLSNAFKFTSNGSVSLEVHLVDKDTKFYRSDLKPENSIAVSVTDTGIGIKESKQRAIFEAFQQADGATNRKYGGTGLGLSISKELAKILGGEIQLESKEGEGSTFTLFLPIKYEVQKEEVIEVEILDTDFDPNEEKSNFSILENKKEPFQVITAFIPDDRMEIKKEDKSILIIEDDKDFAKIMRNISKKKGYKCIMAGDGKSGLKLATQYKPSAIILDLSLPDMNGVRILDNLKFDLDTRHIPVHIISASDEDVSILKKGAIGYLNKPASNEEIDHVFERIEEVNKTIIKELLVIEDDQNSCKAIVKLLKNKELKITTIGSGKEALELLNSKHFDCIILDLGLPDMPGSELLKSLEERDLEMPPVIIYTGKEISREEHSELIKYTGNIVIKGVNSPERLLDEVSLFLHSVENRLPKSQQKIIEFLHSSDQVFKDKKVLLVDDDVRNTFALSKQLGKNGLEVVLADNGELALEKMKTIQGIDLVIMDIMMPVMDGFEAMRQIRKMEEFKYLPIIALTAKAMPEDRLKCIEAGASDYVTKPIEVEKLLSMMRVWLYSRN